MHYKGSRCPWCLLPMATLAVKPKKSKRSERSVQPDPRMRHVARHKDAWRDFLRSDGGDPFGRGMPSTSDRWDGEPHRVAWKRMLRFDVCTYCDRPFSGTVDHIVPSARARPEDDAHTWINYTAACEDCNGSKKDTPMLLWLARRGVLRRS